MKKMETHCFEYAGKKFYASFYTVMLDNYSDTYITKRKMTFCVLRRGKTGVPYTGVAVINPKEKRLRNKDGSRVINDRTGHTVAITKAAHAMFADEVYINDRVKGLVSAFREYLFATNRPDEYAKVSDLKEINRKRHEEKEHHEAQRQRWLMTMFKRRNRKIVNQYKQKYGVEINRHSYSALP